MAYYYYYQQPHTQSGSMSPVSMASELTSPLTPLLLLSPQQQLTLPLLTPVLPSVTTSLPTTTTATIEHNQQQQLPTPNTFIRHCEDMGLFHDLQNIVVMSSLTGPSDTTTTTVPVTNTSTMITTTSTELPINNSSLFGLSSTTVLTPMMMANPFDETFKQAVLQQQKNDSKLSENLSSNINNTDGDLNTPFISTTTIVNTSINHNNSTSTTAALPVDMNTTAVVAAPITVESMRTNTTTVPHLQHQNVFITTPATESTARNMLVMMVEQQKQFIEPTTITTTSDIDTTTITSHDRDCSDSKARKKNKRAIHFGNETTKIKQTLKQNLLVKRQLQKQQKHTLILARRHDPGQIQMHNFSTDVVATNTAIKDIEDIDKHGKQFQQKHKQELLERNRTAAKRCRMKRKQRWELLSEENRRLKIENKRLHDILAKLISRGYGNQHQTASLQVQQLQIHKHQTINQKKSKV